MKIASLLIVLCAIQLFGQSSESQSTKTARRTPVTKLTPKDKLKKAVQASQKQRRLSVEVETTIQNKTFLSVTEYVAPDRYSSKESRDGIPFKEALEISGQRYQKKNDQWIKVRKDPFPLREQFELLFPIKLYSLKGDVIKIKSVSVVELDETVSDGKRYSRYKYSISYRELDWLDSGIAFVNQSNGLMERLENESFGIFGSTTGIWKYDYEKIVTISAPKDYIVRDWID